MSANIPESLRQQLSAAGKKGIKKLSTADRSKGGRRAWAARLAKARAEEAQQQEKVNRFAPPQA